MNIHEYQAKALLKGFGAPVAAGVPVFSANEAEAAARSLPGPLWVVKSQIHAGGRGKGRFKEASAGEKGGVHLLHGGLHLGRPLGGGVGPYGVHQGVVLSLSGHYASPS